MTKSATTLDDKYLQDGGRVFMSSNQALVRLGVTHTFETYEGTHVSRVKERFATKVLPFFSTNLADKVGKGK